MNPTDHPEVTGQEQSEQEAVEQEKMRQAAEQQEAAQQEAAQQEASEQVTSEPAAQEGEEPAVDLHDAEAWQALQQERDSWQQKSEEHYQRFLRAQADMDNMRRRFQAEREQFNKFGAAKLMEQLLPVLDNLERALAASTQADQQESALAKGVSMVYEQFRAILMQEGAEIIEATGVPFDPEIHQAVSQVARDDMEAGLVVDVLQKGYRLHGRLLRPAMVSVSSES